MNWRMSIRGLLVSTAAAAVLLPAATAPAAVAPIKLGNGDHPGVGVDAAGNAFVAWRGPRDAMGVSPLLFCRVQKGASACGDGAAKLLPAPGTSESRPFVFVSGARVVVVESRFSTDPATRGLYLLTSNDGGTTFGPARNVAQVGLLLDAVAGPGDTISVVGSYSFNLRFENIAVDATTDEPGFATLSPTDSELDLGAVDLDGVTPFVLLYDGAGNAAWRRWNGSGSLNDAASWTAPSTPGYLGEEPELAGGPLGLFAGGRQRPTSTAPIVRKFERSGFRPQVLIEQTSANPEIAQDAGKRLHAVYGASDLTHAFSDDGVTFKHETLVTSASPSERARLAAATDHSGAVVYASGGAIHLARFGGTATAPSDTGSKTITVRGGTITLTGPRTCVPAHESFYAKVSFKRKSRRSQFVKVTRASFSIDGKRHASDRAAPFRQSLLQFDIPAGTAHSLKARVKIKLSRGKPLTKTIAVGFKYCAA
jgi:hypothetical protein